MFSTPVYSLNLGGSHKIGSNIGAICTALLVIVTVGFSAMKMVHLTTCRNPRIMYSEEKGNFLTANDSLDISQ
jgi:hypothetical protein